jgi:hypothetical protein
MHDHHFNNLTNFGGRKRYTFFCLIICNLFIKNILIVEFMTNDMDENLEQ